MQLTERQIEQKIEEYMGLITSMALKIHLDGYEKEDIIQELSMEFVKALKNYDETKGAELKSYFINYQRRWLTRKLQAQNAYKRPKVTESLNSNIFDVKTKDFETYIDTIMDDSETPEDIDYQNRLKEHLETFFDSHKFGWVLRELYFNNKKLTEIAKEKNVTPQNIGAKKLKAEKSLKIFLQNKGYIK